MQINSNVTIFSAEQLFNAMDKKDGQDNRITGSVWDVLVQECGAKRSVTI